MRRSTEAASAMAPARVRGPIPIPMLAMVLILVATLVGACDRGTVEPVLPRHRADLRIVSLSPALTQALLTLGLGDRIVGRSRYCTGVPECVPVVGDLREHDAELLLRLRPTDIVVQPPSTGIDAGLAELALAHGWRVHGYRLDTIADIRAALSSQGRALAPADTAEADALRARADDALATLAQGLDALAASPIPDGASPVLLLFSTEPPMAFGRGTYLGEILEVLGGRNAVAADGYPELSLEDVVRLAPATVVLVKGGEAGSATLEPLLALTLPAVHAGRIRVLARPEAMLPSPAVVEVAHALRRCIADDNAPAGTPP